MSVDTPELQLEQDRSFQRLEGQVQRAKYAVPGEFGGISVIPRTAEGALTPQERAMSARPCANGATR